jgi:hypothetical protein
MSKSRVKNKLNEVRSSSSSSSNSGADENDEIIWISDNTNKEQNKKKSSNDDSEIFEISVDNEQIESSLKNLKFNTNKNNKKPPPIACLIDRAQSEGFAKEIIEEAFGKITTKNLTEKDFIDFLNRNYTKINTDANNKTDKKLLNNKKKNLDRPQFSPSVQEPMTKKINLNNNESLNDCIIIDDSITCAPTSSSSLSKQNANQQIIFLNEYAKMIGESDEDNFDTRRELSSEKTKRLTSLINAMPDNRQKAIAIDHVTKYAALSSSSNVASAASAAAVTTSSNSKKTPRHTNEPGSGEQQKMIVDEPKTNTNNMKIFKPDNPTTTTTTTNTASTAKLIKKSPNKKKDKSEGGTLHNFKAYVETNTDLLASLASNDKKSILIEDLVLSNQIENITTKKTTINPSINNNNKKNDAILNSNNVNSMPPPPVPLLNFNELHNNNNNNKKGGGKRNNKNQKKHDQKRSKSSNPRFGGNGNGYYPGGYVPVPLNLALMQNKNKNNNNNQTPVISNINNFKIPKYSQLELRYIVIDGSNVARE